MSVESYIVRIYGRSTKGALGVVERVAEGTAAAFKDKDELWQILLDVSRRGQKRVKGARTAHRSYTDEGEGK